MILPKVGSTQMVNSIYWRGLKRSKMEEPTSKLPVTQTVRKLNNATCISGTVNKLGIRKYTDAFSNTEHAVRAGISYNCHSGLT